MGKDCCGGGADNEKPPVVPRAEVGGCAGDGCCAPAGPDASGSDCEAGCCADDAAIKDNKDKPADGCCSGGTCGAQPESESDADSCADADADDCQAGCCGGGGAPAERKAEQDDCCGGGRDAEPGCCDGCDDDSDASTRDVKLECCTSKDEQCDEKCIIAAAAMECEKTCDDDAAHNDATGHQHDHDKNGHHPASACSTHLTKAFEQYGAYLETARCICRSILDRGLPASCCDKTDKPKAAKVARVDADTAVFGTSGHSTAHSMHQSGAGHHGQHHHRTLGGMKHRGKKARAPVSTQQDDLAIKPVKSNQGSCCSDGCDDPADPSQKSRRAAVTIRNKEIDVENDAGLEHVALIVAGMTCSGCGSKLERILNAAPGVSNVRVNFVRGTAEFSLDPSGEKADHLIRETEKATGFSCTRLTGNDQSLDLLATGDAAKALTELAIPGITEVNIINKKVIRVSYDPAIIGARSLVDQIGSLANGLAPPAADPSVASGRKKLYDLLVKTSVSAVLTIPVCVLAWGEDLVDGRTRAYISLVLATLVQLVAVPTLYRPAILSLIHDRSIEMDMLVCISITAAYLYSLVAFGFRMANQPLETSEFFETSTLLITLILLGRLIAAVARIRAVAAVSLRSLQASTATLVDDGKEYEIDARLLQYGDKFMVQPHTRIPTDGVVTSGSSEVDESMLTGESMPVTKKTGDPIIAGTVNGSGVITASLTRLPGKNTVTDIAELVEEAAGSKPKMQDLADRVASWFVPVVTTIAVLTTVIWVIVGLRVRNERAGEAVPDAITYAVAVLAVSCPCALGLAVPMVLVIAGGIAARGGVVIKTAECTAEARKVTDVVLDKTGTLTEGTLDVLAEEYFIAPQEAIAVTKALVSSNNHPVSAAVAKHLEQAVAKAADIGDVQAIPGCGVQATKAGSLFQAGTPSWTQNEANPAVHRLLTDSMTVLLVTRNSTPIALFGLRANLRPEANAVIAKLKSRNITIHLVSGDQVDAVKSTADSVGILPDNVRAKCTPAQKREYVASLMAENKFVMFCGDGTNDAVAVAQANVGVQLGNSYSSSDITRGAADVVLLAGLGGIPFLLDVSRVAFHRMVFNFVWSGVYNVLAILLAAGAFVNFRIPPAYAGLGEIVSVLPVIFAAMTMFLVKLRA
ncbi:copper-transporting P-type ATPase [Stachybotrys elegans]|uniref:Copper-transporting P-type ATPase n=1 Tax=Stachybotrys elegans TaxID=80388 RepID=A0A8K0WUR7_9HYPO|nr:copper-transporting P-type ATPase [Stachybotrys elegans]